MTTANQLRQLFSSISTRDWSSVDSVAQSIVRREEEKGHHSAAGLLRAALTTNGANGVRKKYVTETVPTQFASPRLLLPLNRTVILEDVELRSSASQQLQSVLQEWKHRELLQCKGLRPRNRLLFHGPPGCGKSLTACALGTSLNLPVFVVRFDSLIASYLGQTAVNLRQLFEFATRESCVLLFDEIDALGRRRGNQMDVGELDRIVISMLQELEHANPNGLFVATSNLPDELDRALWRRFDLDLEFPLPTKADLTRYIGRKSKLLGVSVNESLRKSLAKRLSYADAERILEAEARRLVLKGI